MHTRLETSYRSISLRAATIFRVSGVAGVSVLGTGFQEQRPTSSFQQYFFAFKNEHFSAYNWKLYMVHVIY